MDLTPVGIFRIDTNGHLVYCNESFKQLSGLPNDYSIIGEGLAEWCSEPFFFKFGYLRDYQDGQY
jgi:PAS domain-containing protein